MLRKFLLCSVRDLPRYFHFLKYNRYKQMYESSETINSIFILRICIRKKRKLIYMKILKKRRGTITLGLHRGHKKTNANKILCLLAYFSHFFGQKNSFKIGMRKLCEELKNMCHNIH